MELRQLRYFLAVAEHLHFGRAAESLHITQPPLSRQIAALEQALGCSLFDRHSRAVRLTAAGQAFMEQARALLGGLDQAVRGAQASARGERGELRIGFTSMAAWALLPGLLKRYCDRYPQVQLALNEVLPRDLDALVRAGEVDLALSIPTAEPTELAYYPLAQESLCVALPATDGEASQASVALQRLADKPFIGFPRSTAPALHEAVMACCAQAGFEPKVRMRTHLQQTIVNLVAEGLGWALVPESISKLALPGVVFRPVPLSPRITYGASWVAGNRHPCLLGFLALAGLPVDGLVEGLDQV